MEEHDKVDTKSDVELEGNETLLKQFYLTLQATLDQVKLEETDPARKAISDSIRALLAQKPESWRIAYEIERLLVGLLDCTTLEVELKRHLVDAKDLLSKDLNEMYAKLATEPIVDCEPLPVPQQPPDPIQKPLAAEPPQEAKQEQAGAQPQQDAKQEPQPPGQAVPPSTAPPAATKIRRPSLEQKRSLLNRVINDLQWKYTQEHIKRLAANVVIRKAICILAGFVVALIILQLVGEFRSAWRSNESFYLITAAFAGAVGASFSRLTGLNDQIAAATVEGVQELQRWPSLLLRPMIGLTGGLIILYFLKAQFLTGPVLPTWSTRPQIDSTKAGVEKLVDSVLTSVVPSSVDDTSKEKINKDIKAFGNQIDSAIQNKDKILGAVQKLAESVDLRARAVNKKQLSAKLADALLEQSSLPLMDGKNLAILIVWCFLAGFSEKLVPNLLAKAEESASPKK